MIIRCENVNNAYKKILAYFAITMLNIVVQSYIIKFSLSVWLSVCLSIWNRLPNHAHYGDEPFAGDSVGLG